MFGCIFLNLKLYYSCMLQNLYVIIYNTFWIYLRVLTEDYLELRWKYSLKSFLSIAVLCIITFYNFKYKIKIHPSLFSVCSKSNTALYCLIAFKLRWVINNWLFLKRKEFYLIFFKFKNNTRQMCKLNYLTTFNQLTTTFYKISRFLKMNIHVI